jgi:hypothetical protein
MKIQYNFFRSLGACLFFSFSLAACNSEYSFKPRGYFKINLPPRSYQVFDKPDYPYSFEYPVYANIVKDTTLF